MPDERPIFPYDEFHAASDDPEHRAALEAFHREYRAEMPDRERLAAHAERVRGVPSFLAPFERWWLDPKVQGFFADINATGL